MLTTTDLLNRDSESSRSEFKGSGPNPQGLDRYPLAAFRTRDFCVGAGSHRNPLPLAGYDDPPATLALGARVNHKPPRIPRRSGKLPRLDSNQQPSG